MLVLKTKYQKLSRVAFAPDGRGLAAAGAAGAYWWASAFDDPKAVRLASGWCGGVGFTPDGAFLLAIAHAGVCATHLTDRLTRAVTVTGFRPALTVCPVTGLAVAEQWDGSAVTGWRVGPTGGPAHVWSVQMGSGYIGSSVAFAPDDSWFARAERIGGEWQGCRFALRDPATGAEVGTCRGGGRVGCSPAVSPDKEWIAFATENLLTAQSVSDPQRHFSSQNDTTHQFTGLAFHPSGRVLAATSNDETVKLYDTATWNVARTFTWDIGKMRSVAFSPNGTLAAAGSDTGKIVVWDVDV
jgi:WD40 repeat protein